MLLFMVTLPTEGLSEAKLVDSPSNGHVNNNSVPWEFFKTQKDIPTTKFLVHLEDGKMSFHLLYSPV